MNKKLKNIIFATEKNIGYHKILVESCKRNNIELITLGYNKKWEGFTMRLSYWLDYLNTIDDDEIVMINDAYDVIILENGNKIIKKFKRLNKKVIFGYQNSLLTNLFFGWEKTFCCGNIIGYVKYIKIIIGLFFKNKSVWGKYHDDDQLILNNIIIKNKIFQKYCGLDVNKDIFFIVSDDNRYFNINYILNGYINELKLGKNEILNKNNKPVSVLHAPALMNCNYYLNHLNYDTSGIKLITLQILFYKIKQFFNLLKINILLILILYYLKKRFK